MTVVAEAWKSASGGGSVPERSVSSDGSVGEKSDNSDRSIPERNGKGKVFYVQEPTVCGVNY